MKYKLKHIYIYFYSILFIGFVWTVFGNKPLSNYAPIVFMFLSFPIFIFLAYENMCDFSYLLKKSEPNLFKKYVRNYGSPYNKGENISTFSLFNNDDFEKLSQNELKEKYILAKKLYLLGILSFFLFPILGILSVYS